MKQLMPYSGITLKNFLRCDFMVVFLQYEFQGDEALLVGLVKRRFHPADVTKQVICSSEALVRRVLSKLSGCSPKTSTTYQRK